MAVAHRDITAYLLIITHCMCKPPINLSNSVSSTLGQWLETFSTCWLAWCQSTRQHLNPHHDGVPTLLQVLRNDTLLDYTVLINQTAIHSLPAVLNGVNSALLRAATGGGGSITLTRHPLPVLPNERAQQVSQETGMFSFKTPLALCFFPSSLLPSSTLLLSLLLIHSLNLAHFLPCTFADIPLSHSLIHLFMLACSPGCLVTHSLPHSLTHLPIY